MARQFVGSGVSTAAGSREDCVLYAQAMGMARGRYALEKAYNQQIASKVTDFLAAKEEEYGLIPGPYEDDRTRRGALAARKRLPGGATRCNIENALRELLFSDFIAYRTTHPSELVNYPTNITDSPNNFQRAQTKVRLVTLSDDVCVGLGSPQTIGYAAVPLPIEVGASTVAPRVHAGDVLVIDPSQAGLEERVTVTAATTTTFTATFSIAHGAGALCTTQPWPRWTSNQRASLIVVSASAAVEPRSRAAINELMERIARGPSTWAIVAGSSGTTGPFTIGSSPLGATTVSSTAYP